VRATTEQLDTDYLVVGAGAMGMAFADALVDHADVHVTLVDRRTAPGGHWRDAYPFVQLHQSSIFYGVASTLLGGGKVQETGPEAGLQERAHQPEICAYYDDVLRRLLTTGRGSFLGGFEYRAAGDGHRVTSSRSGASFDVNVRRRVVDARYQSPTIPATTPPPFDVAADAVVAPINELVRLAETTKDYVIVGSGKTATDGIVWLLGNGVAPDRITWVRPRDPWMLNRATVQPTPSVAVRLVADIMEAAATAEALEEMFLSLEASGVMLRVDPGVTPTMAKSPTLGVWELELLRTVEDVVRLGHVQRVTAREMVLDHGSIRLPDGALVVHCAASGLQNPPMLPIWSADAIRLRTIRAGFPCFCAALTGYVEATRDDDRERNRLCPPNLFGDSLADWARMQARGAVAARTYGAEPDIAAWANGCNLNPGRMDDRQRQEPAVKAETARLDQYFEPGVLQLAALSGEPLPAVDA
jgi:hypothetical protein